MNYLVTNAKSFLLLSCAFVLAPAVQRDGLYAQPVCAVLLRPAYSYSTDGLVLTVQDRSNTYGLGVSTYWSFGDGATALTPGYHQFDSAGTYTVCLTLSAPEVGCTVEYCRDVTVPNTECAGFDQPFSWESTGNNMGNCTDDSGLAVDSLHWTFDNGEWVSVSEYSQFWPIPGPHFVSLTRYGYGCSTTVDQWVPVDGNVSTCGTGLFVDFSYTFDGTFAQFTSIVVADGVLPVIPLWEYGDGQVDTILDATHYYSGEGPYQACLLMGGTTFPGLDSCFSIVCHTLVPTVVSVPEGVKVEGPAIWPNPCADVLQVAIAPEMVSSSLEVIDALGRAVLRKSLQRSGTLQLDVDYLPSGTYTLLLRRVGAIQQARFVKGY